MSDSPASPQPLNPSPSEPRSDERAAQRKGLGTGALLGIVGGGIGAVVVAIAVVMVLVIGGPRASEPAAQAGSTSPAAAVEAYLTALSESDAQAALRLLSEAPADETLLTDEILASSNNRAQIADIEVRGPRTAEYYADVTATYRLGDTPVTAEFFVTESDAPGSWTISGGTNEIDLSRFDGLALAIDGEPVDSTAELFPGKYEITTTTENFILTGATTLTIKGGYDYLDLSEIDAVLDEEGEQIFRTAVRDAVAPCLAATTLEAGCGLALPGILSDGSVLVENSISRTLTPESRATLDNLRPEYGYGDPLRIRGEAIGTLTTTALFDEGGATSSGEIIFGPYLGAPFVDFTSGTPVVSWG